MLITIIGTGRMARAIAIRALAGGNRVAFMGRDAFKSSQLATELHASAIPWNSRDLPGEMVVLALPYSAALSIAAEFKPALQGKVVVDITNPLNATYDGLTTPADSSAAEEIQKVLLGTASVVKAFNTTFARTLMTGQAGGEPLDMFVAGDDEAAKAMVMNMAAGGGMHPLDVGPLARARGLEQFGLFTIMLQGTLGLGFGSAWKLIYPPK
jgi:8-hydroxy-5-deazaflavin:NADPH oxidoreductase